jgi:biopolymer transport protein ExbD
MTPLVDVAFLLLTFFMFATTMSQPQVMQIQVPPQDGDVEVTKLLTVLVRGDGRLFYRDGTDEPVATNLSEIERIASHRILAEGNALVTALRAEPTASYGTVVAVLDRLNAVETQMEHEFARRAERRERRFTIAPIGDEERQLINDR